MADKVTNKSILAEVDRELRKEAVKEATAKLKVLRKQEANAKKVLKNVQREIRDFMDELEIDESDGAV